MHRARNQRNINVKKLGLGLLVGLAAATTAPCGALAQDAHAGGEALVPVAPAQKPGFDRIHEADLRADLGFLASDGLEGRMSLAPGDDASVQWIAAEFAKAGLVPAARDADGKPSYLQSVPLVEYRPNSAANVLTLKSGKGSQSWKAPHLLGGYRDDIDLTAPLAFAGYGITAPGLGYDDYKGLDVRGKIVLVFEHEPQENDPASRFGGTGNTRYATNRVKALNAQAHGALALVVVAEPNRKHPRTSTASSASAAARAACPACRSRRWSTMNCTSRSSLSTMAWARSFWPVRAPAPRRSRRPSTRIFRPRAAWWRVKA
jgi:hypothetical protein